MFLVVFLCLRLTASSAAATAALEGCVFEDERRAATGESPDRDLVRDDGTSVRPSPLEYVAMVDLRAAISGVRGFVFGTLGDVFLTCSVEAVWTVDSVLGLEPLSFDGASMENSVAAFCDLSIIDEDSD